MSTWYWSVGKTKNAKELKKFFLNDFIHPDIVKDLEIKNKPSKMEFFYKGELLLQFLSSYDTIFSGNNNIGIDSKYLDLDELLQQFKAYYQMKHEKSAKVDNYYFRILALLDKRTGKRILQSYIDNGDFFGVVVMNRDFLMEKLYRIRFELAGIKV